MVSLTTENISEELAISAKLQKNLVSMCLLVTARMPRDLEEGNIKP